MTTPLPTKPPMRNICPFSLQSHVVGMQERKGVVQAGGAPQVEVQTQATFSPCGGEPCAVYDRKRARCGLIAPTAEEIAAALVAALKEAGKA